MIIANNQSELVKTKYYNSQQVGIKQENTENIFDNYCTDGEDDGKIGIFSALGNASEGMVKTLGNGIKGLFTGSDGKFSTEKTLATIGLATVCIVFPVVGLTACAIGGAMGAIQVGKGLYDATTANTDAEAKKAWENIGGGAFTVATSIVGGKASYKAINKSTKLTNKKIINDVAESVSKASTKLTNKTSIKNMGNISDNIAVNATSNVNKLMNEKSIREVADTVSKISKNDEISKSAANLKGLSEYIKAGTNEILTKGNHNANSLIFEQKYDNISQVLQNGISSVLLEQEI